MKRTWGCLIFGCDYNSEIVFDDKEAGIAMTNYKCKRCGDSFGITTFPMGTFEIKEGNQ